MGIFERLTALLALLGALAFSLTGCTDIASGDSLIVQAASGTTHPAGLGATSTQGGVVLEGVSGTAPCDYIGRVRADVAQYHPVTEDLVFSGNNRTPCTGYRTGRALADNYHQALVTITDYLISQHVRVIYSAPVCTRTAWTNGDPLLRSMESGLAAFYRAMGANVAYSEHAALSVCPGWQFHPELRDPDGIHLNARGIGIFAAAVRQEAQQ